MSVLRWVVGAALLTLLLVAKDIPAKVAGDFLSQRISGLMLKGVAGTFWQGRAGSARYVWQGNVYALGELRWNIEPLSLFSLNPCAKVSTSLGKQQTSGKVCVDWQGTIDISDANISGPAALAELWLPIQVAGSLSAQVVELQLQENQLSSLQANVSWQDARFHNSHDWLALGSYAARLQEDGQGGVKADVFDLQGPLKIKLKASLPRNASPSTTGTLRLLEGAPPEIGQVLTAFGFTQSGGEYQLNWPGA